MSDHSTHSTSGGTGNMATDETGSLIVASKVNGTRVYNRQGEHLARSPTS